MYWPVVAPGKGATPVGKLCVSAVNIIWRVESFAIFTKESWVESTGIMIFKWENPFIALELSLNLIKLLSFEYFWVSATNSIKDFSISFPWITILPYKIENCQLETIMSKNLLWKTNVLNVQNSIVPNQSIRLMLGFVSACLWITPYNIQYPNHQRIVQVLC